MVNRLYCGIASALLACAVLAPSAHASSLDLGQLNVNVTDVAGAFEATDSGAIIHLASGPLSGDMITAASFDLKATFNAAEVLQGGGTLKLLGTLRTSGGISLEAVDFEGALTGYTQSNNSLVFNFNVTTADPLLATNFGSAGIVQLVISGGPANPDLGRGFTVAGNASTVDVTAVAPTPTAAMGGTALLGCLAIGRLVRTRKLA